MGQRTYDVVLYGATGFTGRQTAHYFADRLQPGDLPWAIAGRNKGKLEQVRSELGEEWADLPLVVADATDPEAVAAMVRATRVIVTTAGPFDLYGEPLVAACVAEGTDYLDITGEVQYVRRLIDEYHQAAQEREVRIVPFCGFDSVPADLGAFTLVRHFREGFDTGTRRVKGFFKGRGGLNGGTLASVLRLTEVTAREVLYDPFLLNPPSARRSVRDPLERDTFKPRYDRDLNEWVGPFFMSLVNTRVVRRSAALMAAESQPYGDEFAYQEYMQVGRPLRAVRATMLGMGFAMFDQMMRLGPMRGLVKRVGPDPGDGPSEEVMNAGFTRYTLVGEDETGRTAWLRVQGEGDPGNRITVKILCEAALALIRDRAQLPEQAGILTPAVTFGQILPQRLRDAGMTWQVSADRPG